VTPDASAPVRVELRGFPLRAWQRAEEHHEELMREFALLLLDRPAPGSVPQRLVRLVEEVRDRYAASAEAPEAVREAALQRGDTHVDLVYEIPAAAGPQVARLLALLEEADEYCRRGEHLLTLATPPGTAAFRRWYLGEFVRQARGEAPLPWREDAEGTPSP